jgi:hypothetical protein
MLIIYIVEGEMYFLEMINSTSPHEFRDIPTCIIEPPGKWVLHELWNYRELKSSLTRRSLLLRHKTFFRTDRGVGNDFPAGTFQNKDTRENLKGEYRECLIVMR